MDKTIKYLNEKWWYRLLKVIAMMIFFIFGVIMTLLIYINFKPNKIVDNEKTTIYCYNEIYTAKELNLIYYKGINNDFIYWAKNNCREQEFQKNPEKYPEKQNNTKNSITSNSGAIDLYKYIYHNPSSRVPDDQNFSINESYKLTDSYLKVLLYIIIWWLIIYTIFEILKRSFYYIALGTIKPKK